MTDARGMMEQPKIIHTSIAPPINEQANKPFLFGTSDQGEVFFYDWINKRWRPLAEID